MIWDDVSIKLFSAKTPLGGCWWWLYTGPVAVDTFT